MKTYTISVEARDIQRTVAWKAAKRLGRYCANCPVANAWQRKFRRHTDVIVCGAFIEFARGGQLQSVETPHVVETFIHRFDLHHNPAPFTFEVRF